MLRSLVWKKLTDVLEVLAAFIIRVIALMMEAASTFETSVTSTRLHGGTSQQTFIFIIAAVRT
jgi:hypothetical protein